MNLDPEKLLVLFVIALLVLGPNRLPQAARSFGKALAEVRRYTSSFRAEVDQVLAEPRAMVQSALRDADMRAEFKQSLQPGPGEPPVPVPPTVEGEGESTVAGAAGSVAGAEGAFGPAVYTPGAGGGLGRGMLPSAVPDEPGLN